MRAGLPAAMLMLLAQPVAAAGWGHYENARFGFSIDVPPGFVEQSESANGDGDRFTTPTAELRAYGGNIVDTGFAGEVGFEQQAATEDGWALTYQAATPGWATFSGKKGARILYARFVAICGGTQFIGYWLEYSRADIKPFNAVIDRLTASLKPPATC